ncbi:MAG: alpha/beta hydrolase-fold protein [Candidatus Krumholzibacteriia bacterium]
MTRTAAALAMLCLLAGCHDAPPADPVPPHDTLTIPSVVLGEARVINVCLPPGYDGEAAFDVVYMPDGGVAEDFPHIANTLAALMAAGEIRPVILVGIENTVRRRDLTGPTEVATDREVAPVIGGSAAFRRFVADELIPTIEARYRCTADRTLVGESLAAWFIMETFFLEPDLFAGYIAISPSLWWNDHALVRQARARLATWGDRRARLYLSVGNETDIGPYTDELAAILADQAPAGLTWRYDPRKQERHSTIFRAAKAAGFRAVLAPAVPAPGE